MKRFNVLKHKPNKPKRDSILKRKVANLFSRKKTFKRDSYRRRVKGGSFLNSVLKIIVLALFLGLSILLLYNLVNYVSNLRKSILNNSLETSNSVIGFDDVPEYPKSSFIFKNLMSDQNVKNFLSSGQSIYRLEPGQNIDEVFKYYSDRLPKNGWQHVLTVPLESEDRKYGEYWTKDNKGIRIYSKLNDIWYQSVSTRQATTGLEDEVKKEVELQLLLSETDKQDLRPDYPWKLSFSNDYIVSYGGSDIGELQTAQFKKLGSNNKVTIEPLGYIGARPYDAFLTNALKKINKTEKSNWKVVNSVVTAIAGQEAISAKIINGDNYAEAYVVGNPRNTVVYLLRSNDENDPFLKYVVEKIEPVRSSF